MLLLASLCAATLGCQQGFFQRTASSLREPILLGAESLLFPFFPSVPWEAEAGLHSMHCVPTLVGAVLHGRDEPGGRWGRELLFSLSWHGREQIFLLLAQKLREMHRKAAASPEKDVRWAAGRERGVNPF